VCIDRRAAYLRPERAWWVAHRPGLHPTESVATALAGAFEPIYDPSGIVVHSTSWRFDQDMLILSFLALLPVVSPLACPAGFSVVEVARPAEPAEPGFISDAQVLAHGLRHFALLRLTDPQISRALCSEWHEALAVWEPLPAGMLDHYRLVSAGSSGG
jgi:hypothetical protein